jgi:hypothetical protein
MEPRVRRVIEPLVAGGTPGGDKGLARWPYEAGFSANED